MNELKDKLGRLVFDFQSKNFKAYGESQTRLSYIDKFWTYLGWDISNVEQVQVERTDRKHQRPDYTFFNGRKTAFFVEAKKPSENLKNLNHIFQTKIYCFNAKVPIAVLTDFEEFRPFRAIGKPKYEDGNKGIIKQFDLTYEAYPDMAYELLNTFGREAVLGGSFDELVKPTKLELRDTVDKLFLSHLSQWRIELAEDINKSNNFNNEFDLAEAVQRILDRIIFLRILQDKDIEPNDYISEIANCNIGDAYEEFVKICKKLAPKYNGLIFNSHPLSENLNIKRGLFKKIAKELIYDNSLYRFNVLPVEMLGTIYEKFLGDEISFGARGKVVIDQKPEVRKAGGVYYTPQYIVEYIVQNTVGKLLYGEQGIGDRVSGIGDRVSGIGDRVSGDKDNFDVKNKSNLENNNEILQRVESLATGDRPRGNDLQDNNEFSERGEIWVDEPDTESGSLDSGEHSRGVRQGFEKGIPVSSLIGEGFPDGIGNTSDNSKQDKLHNKGTIRKSLDSSRSSRKTINRTTNFPKTQNPNTLNPIPYTRRPPCRTPEDVAKIKILDPACGSGSFLLGAFDLLIKWHEDYFSKYPEKAVEKSGKQSYLLAYLDPSEKVTLTARMKGKILQNNIFGVDLDKQATEVAQMSLYIKVLEGLANESEMSLGFREAILPTMENNIKCGNSLIGTDFIQDDFFGLSQREKHKINPFDWEEAFPAVFSGSGDRGSGSESDVTKPNTQNPIPNKGGFDAVIGNPPYIKIQTMMEFNPRSVEYLKKYYFSAASKNIDIYVTFLEKAHQLINQSGIAGYILPHKFFQSQMGENIRHLLTEKKALNKVISFGANQIFEEATTYTCLFFINKLNNLEFEYKEYKLADDIENTLKENNFIRINSNELVKDKWNFGNLSKTNLFEKLDSMPIKLKDITRKIFVGLQTSADNIYVLKRINLNDSDNDILRVFSKSLGKEIPIERGLVKPFLMGKDVKRFMPLLHNVYVIFPYIVKDNRAMLMEQKYIKDNFPLGWNYLLENKKDLESREKGKFNNNWWQFGRTQNLTEFEFNKIIFPDITNKPEFSFDFYGNIYHTSTVYSLAFNDKAILNKYFYLGILNSKLTWYFVSQHGTILRGGYTRFHRQYIENFPIPSPKPPAQDKMVELVERMLKLHKDLQGASDFDKKHIEQYIVRTDKEIDALVYDLYGLTDEEIRIVEGK